MPKPTTPLKSQFQATFDSLKGILAERAGEGHTVVACLNCGYPSSIVEAGFVPLYFQRCLVCAHKARYVSVICDCDAEGLYDCASHKGCKVCHKVFTFAQVEAQNQPKVCCSKPSRRLSGAMAKCHVCRKPAASVFHFDEQWLCLNCLEEHRAPGTCEECHTVQTGDIEGSFFEGCIECGGRVSWD